MAPSDGFTAWVGRLARAHTRGLASVASREGLGGDDAVDAVQEAFVTLLTLPQARSLADHDEDAFSLLGAIVRNAARNARRRHHRARPHVSIDDEPLLDEGLSIDAWIERAEEHAALLGCVAKLGEIQRHVVTLRLLEQMSTAEVATSLALTPGNVALALHRAKAALQRCLADDEALVV
ncbi:MAG: sigma-70 family RNA polymerase sigma factor [Deltaproteobacteria bacterium]|nr:sigma-70 family RNA polymerase sigma factor [Deltaproteobacteria bacterium]